MWKQLGLRLGQGLSVLDDFEQKDRGNINCCVRVFDKWIKNGGSRHYPLTWKSVYDVLCTIDHRGTADDMKSMLESEMGVCMG